MNETAETPWVPTGTPIPIPRALPTMFYNVDKLPALFAALAAAQAEYLPVVRDKKVVQKLRDRNTNELNGKQITFWYAELSGILDATRAALAKHGLSFVQPIEGDTSDVWINSILSHADGGMIMTRMQVPGAESLPKFGGNITYIRRYAAGPMLGVSAEDDADTGLGEDEDDDGAFPPMASQRRTIPAETEAREQPQRRSATADDEKPVSPGQLKNLKDKIEAAGLTPEVVMAMCTRLGVKHGITDKMTVAEWKLVRADIDKVV